MRFLFKKDFFFTLNFVSQSISQTYLASKAYFPPLSFFLEVPTNVLEPVLHTIHFG